MAFADVILTESDAGVIMADRHAALAGNGMTLTPVSGVKPRTGAPQRSGRCPASARLAAL